MSNLIKLRLVFITILILAITTNLFAKQILPIPRPTPDDSVKIKAEKKKIILPQKKPNTESQLKSEDDEVEELKTEEIDVVETFIYPKKKPLIYKKVKEKTAQKSSVLSQNDFLIAKRAFAEIKKRKWNSAIKISKKAKDKAVYKLVLWLYLKNESNNASFYDYVNFINLNKDYPRISRLRYLAEQKISISALTPRIIINWFADEMPVSGYGKIVLGDSYIKSGKNEQGISLIKEGWTTAKLSKNNLKYFRKKYKKFITTEDNIKRADWLAWENKYWDLKRMLIYLPKEHRALYNARQLLMSKSYGVDDAINKIPYKFKNDIGLNYDRLKWRRKRGRLESSLEILLNVPKDPKKLIRTDKWWIERAIITRSLIYKKKYPLAYKIASNHSLSNGSEYAEAEWLSGWIALTFLEDPNLALKHFENFYNNVGYPISLSRGAYWLGKTHEIINDNKNSIKWYEEASKYLTTYYGQLAHLKLNPDGEFILSNDFKVSKKYAEEFYKNPLIKSVLLLKELNKTKYSKDLLKHLAKINISKGSEILAGKLAIQVGRYDYAIQIAKSASYEKRFHNEINYPVINTPTVINKKRMPSQDLILAVIRQESEFDAKANSYVGAKGMMQLMTYTARLVAKQAKFAYNKSKLTKDPNYNINLGSYYLAGLLEQYEGSYPFALAAYNAGPRRVKYWKKINGNPQKKQIDYVNWIELIKFKETRNYVQRVLENVNVYRYMILKKPIKLHNFFEDKPHY